MHRLKSSSLALASRSVRHSRISASCCSDASVLVSLPTASESREPLSRPQLNCRHAAPLQNMSGIYTTHRDPLLNTSSGSCMRIFSVSSLERRESRKKWLNAAEVAAGATADVGSQKPEQPPRFVVRGTERLLSTSPAVPGYSILQFRGKLG